MLILSGVPVLSTYIHSEEKLSKLLRPVTFDLIHIDKDIQELMGVAYSYADLAGVNFDPLSSVDFFQRLSFSCADRWGLAIELIINAVTECGVNGERDISIYYFAKAYSRTYETEPGCSPFIIENYRQSFDQGNVVEFLKKREWLTNPI